MKTFQKLRQRGFSLIEGLLILVAVFVIILIAFLTVLSHKNTSTDSPSSKETQAAARQKPTGKFTYYDCLDKNGGTDSQTTTDCTTGGVTYHLPGRFTTSMIRGYEKLPQSSLPVVTSIAQQTFACTSPNGGTEATEARIYSTYDDSFVYLHAGCDAGYREILYNGKAGGWFSIFQGQSYVDCPTVDKYKIPRILFTSSTDSSDHRAQCVNDDGSFRDITY